MLQLSAIFPYRGGFIQSRYTIQKTINKSLSGSDHFVPVILGKFSTVSLEKTPQSMAVFSFQSRIISLGRDFVQSVPKVSDSMSEAVRTSQNGSQSNARR